jgi:hypothetical protein
MRPWVRSQHQKTKDKKKKNLSPKNEVERPAEYSPCLGYPVLFCESGITICIFSPCLFIPKWKDCWERHITTALPWVGGFLVQLDVCVDNHENAGSLDSKIQ